MSATAAALMCLVVAVHDGDTFTARCGDDAPQRRYRLAEIDAPELRQPYGKASKHALSAVVFQRDVGIDEISVDKYGRPIVSVTVNDQSVQWKLVEAGMAWCYTAYVTHDECFGIERKAMAAKRGLWADPAPVAPWEFRRSK